jgi:tetratricopeptide (TPR) repeat protein
MDVPEATMTVLPLLLLAGSVGAAPLPELAVVGLHVDGVDAQQARRAVETLEASLREDGRVTVVTHDEVAHRIDGRESLIVGDAFLGQARGLLDEGRVLYERASPDQAIPVLEEAVRAFNAAMAYTTENRSLIEALLLLGFANLVMGEEDTARRAFGRVVLMDPGRLLDEINYAPRIVNFYAGVRAEVLAEGYGDIEVITPLPGAEVYIDGRRVGVTPMVVEQLPVGRHFLGVVGADGYRNFGVIDIQADRRGVARVALEDRDLARPDDDARGRARQTEELYRSLGRYLETDAILIAGLDDSGELGLQVYACHTGTFSKVLHTDPGDDPYEAAADLAPALAGYLTAMGDIRPDRVSPSVLALDVASNELLEGLLLNPQPEWEVAGGGGDDDAERKSRWYLWAGAGVVAAGGATAATLLLTDTGPGGDEGTIVVEIP